MRKYAWILGVVLMVFCIGVGIFLPHILFSKTVDKVSKQIEKYETEPVEIGYVNTVINAMRSCSDGEYTFDYQEEMANLSGQQLAEICNSFLDELKLSEWGYSEINVNDSNMKASCHLVVISYDEEYRFKIKEAQSYPTVMNDAEYRISANNDEKNSTISIVIWRVEVTYSPGCTIVLTVDDKNQKVIQMYRDPAYADKIIDFAYVDMSTDYTYQDLNNLDDYVSKVMVPFFSSYYKVSVEIVESGNSYCLLRMTDKNEEAVLIFIYDYCGQINFTLFY